MDAKDLSVNSAACEKIFKNISKVVVGKERTIELVRVALIAEGHALQRDVPDVPIGYFERLL